MRDLSLHILDLVENSVRAKASIVRIGLDLKVDKTLTLTIQDDGCGMSPEMVQTVLNPFVTSRTTRKVGLGIPLMAQNARLTGGDVTLESTVGKGTTLSAVLHTDSIDCLPLGDVAGTLASLISANPDKPDFVLTCSSPLGQSSFDTMQVRQVLGDVPLNTPEVTVWILDAINEEIQPIFGGAIL